MRNSFLTVSLLAMTTLAGCAVNAPPADRPSEPGDETTNETGETGEEGEEGKVGETVTADGKPILADVIDFGAALAGAATLSQVTCPALSMPKTSPAPALYVDAKATGKDAGTKEDPFRTLAKAFGAAKLGAVIYVAAGTYAEQVIIPNKGLTVLGGFAADFGSRTDACATVFEAPNMNAPVFAAGGDVTGFAMEGLTVQKGPRGLSVLSGADNRGNYTIARCVFAENGDENAVGGAVAINDHHVRIFGSVFRNNRAAKGAAIAAGGDVKLTIDQNVVLDNKGYSDHGGGLYLSATSTKITRNTFRGNATGVGINAAGLGGGWGGAVIIYSNSDELRGKADFSFNVFTENTAAIGAAVFVDDGADVTMSHDLVYRNRGYRENGLIRGASIYVDGTGVAGGGSTFTGEYLTVVNNNYDEKGVQGATSVGGNVYVEGFSKASFTNSIFWNNGANALYVEAGENELTITNSIAPSSCTSANGEGFITASSTICKIGAGVVLPGALSFANEAANDYQEMSGAAPNMGAFAKL